jgi:hypothetical protein
MGRQTGGARGRGHQDLRRRVREHESQTLLRVPGLQGDIGAARLEHREEGDHLVH